MRRELVVFEQGRPYNERPAWAAEWADGLQNFKRRNGEPTAVVDGSWPVRGVRERQGGPGARAEVGEEAA